MPRSPSDNSLKHACKLSIENEKPIMMDYWIKSLDKKALIGVKSAGEKLLVKNEDEYTSPIVKVYKVELEYIVETENSLYVVCAAIPTKRIS